MVNLMEMFKIGPRTKEEIEKKIAELQVKKDEADSKSIVEDYYKGPQVNVVEDITSKKLAKQIQELKDKLLEQVD